MQEGRARSHPAWLADAKRNNEHLQNGKLDRKQKTYDLGTHSIILKRKKLLKNARILISYIHYLLFNSH